MTAHSSSSITGPATRRSIKIFAASIAAIFMLTCFAEAVVETKQEEPRERDSHDISPKPIPETSLDELYRLYTSLATPKDGRSVAEIIDVLKGFKKYRINHQNSVTEADDPLAWENFVRIARDAAMDPDDRAQIDQFVNGSASIPEVRNPTAPNVTPLTEPPQPASTSQPEPAAPIDSNSNENQPVFMGKVGERVNAEKAEVEKSSTNKHAMKFKGGEVAAVWVKGLDDAQLSVSVRDESGSLVVNAVDGSSDCVVKWWPAWTATFSVEVRNPSGQSATYFLYTN